MADVPPRVIRRALTIPGTLLLAVVAVALLPITLVVAALHDIVHLRHRGRAIRSVVVVTVFLWIESWAIGVLGKLWLTSGFGRRIHDPEIQREHYELVRRYLDRCFALVTHLLGVRVELEGVVPSSLKDRPLLVFCRHAGVGDSLLIVHALMQHFDREPRIILKDLLQWAPAIDIALNRLPTGWITAPASPPPALVTAAAPASPSAASPPAPSPIAASPPAPSPIAASPPAPSPPAPSPIAPGHTATGHPVPGQFLRDTGEPVGAPAPGTLADRAQERIGELATGLDGNDALVIFPEGGNFTPKRWRRAIDRLRREGRRRHARQAEQMLNVLPPRPGGVLAALAAGPEADVVYVAQTGTDHLMSARDVWRALPLREPIRMHWWQIPAHQVPRVPEEQIAWLYGWWKQIDQWVASNRPAGAPAPASSPAPAVIQFPPEPPVAPARDQ